MTDQATPSSTAEIVRRCRRRGDWSTAAEWLAASLNGLAATSRRELAEQTQPRVDLVHGDRREPDVIYLPDGTRVCWHLGSTPRATRWVVERASERCPFG